MSNNKNSNKKRGNKKNSKSSKSSANIRKDDQSIRDQMVPESNNNDPSWYEVTPAIGEAGASLPYSVFTGTKESVFEASVRTVVTADGTISNESNNATPGVFTLEYISVPGHSNSPTSAVNVAARSIYSFVRHQNSGSKNYESPDLMIYVLGMSQVYNLILEAKRIYKLAYTYSGVNRLIPDAILKALGADSDDIRENLAQFKYGLNLAIVKARSLFIPDAFKMFQRQALLSSVVLVDSTSVRSQFYTYRMKYRFKWNATGPNGSSIQPIEILNDRSHIDILNDINDCLDALLRDEDVNIMSGDILKAYGEENCYRLSEVEDMPLEFIYDEDMLNQIQNAFTVGTYATEDGFTYPVSQNAGYVTFNPHASPLTGAGIAENASNVVDEMLIHKRYFNSHKDAPNWQDNLEWSRFTMSGDFDDNDGYLYYTFGSELLLDYTITMYEYSANSTVPTLNRRTFKSVVLFTNDYSQQSIQLIALLAQFDWHPVFYLFNGTFNTSVSYLGAMYDPKVHTIVDSNVLTRMHELATMGLFVTKQMTKS